MDRPLEARCGCGKLVVALQGVTDARYLCCCSECQRRTGAPYGVSWYYTSATARRVSGTYGTHKRVGPKGTSYRFHYCLDCGSTVFWTIENSNSVGVAAGCVPAALHEPPVKAVWVGERPRWVPLPLDIPWHEGGTKSPVVREAD